MHDFLDFKVKYIKFPYLPMSLYRSAENFIRAKYVSKQYAGQLPEENKPKVPFNISRLIIIST